MQCNVGTIPIEKLPDDFLLAIFGFYVRPDRDEDSFPIFTREAIERWQTLVHVCRRWRNVVFGSPCRLNLRLFCAPRTPVRDMLNIWPPLPLVVWDCVPPISGCIDPATRWRNIISVLEHNSRVCKIKLSTGSDVGNAAVMQKPFPELTDLDLYLRSYGPESVVPDSFLGRSTPRLRKLDLDAVPYPGLPGLLLSTTHLVTLRLWNIPNSGYISPEAMVTCLTSLTSLRTLILQFKYPYFLPDRDSRRPPPPTRSVLPALTDLCFTGVSEYLKDLVAPINVPLLSYLRITFFHQIDFHTPQLFQLIGRTPKLKTPNEVRVQFHNDVVRVRLPSRTMCDGDIIIEVLCRASDWQLLSMAQVCASALSLSPTLEKLYIYEPRYSRPNWNYSTENALWLGLLCPFTSVKNLYLSEDFAPRIAPALQELVTLPGSLRGMMPSLHNLFLEGFRSSKLVVHEGIGQFVAARQLSGHPITISLWERDSDWFRFRD
jgi:hypothetical protein